MADLRKEMHADDSTASVTSITDSLRNLIIDSWNAGTYVFGNSELEKAKPEYILNRMLSTKAAISTDSSLAEMNQRARDDASMQTFSCVGAGQTGTVYALKGTTMVIKLPNSPDKVDILFNDFENHCKAQKAFSGVSVALSTHINIPAIRMWVDPKSQHFWDTNAALFQNNIKVPDYGLVSERIYPLPAPVRSALVDTFAPKIVKENKHKFLASPKNNNCLVRLYLGRRNDDTPTISPDRFHLGNFPLHVNEMEQLKLDTPYYARLMAQALAIIHWRANLDANDIEFVLGSSPVVNAFPSIETMHKDNAATAFISDFHHRTVSVWVLDFNLCKPFAMTTDGLKQLVDGFYWNDPYYPRPTSSASKDKQLWNIFAKHYIQVSAELVTHSMPEAFIKAVEERGTKRSGNNLFG